MERRRVKGQFVKEVDGAADESVPRVARRWDGLKPPRPKYCRTFARARVAEALPLILARFLEEAIGGSIAHAKAVMVLGGLDKGDIVPRETKRRSRTLASILDDMMKPEAVNAVPEGKE